MKPEHVHFRLSHEAWVRYSSQAQAHEMALGSYLRLRLEQQDEFLAGELAKLKLAAQPAPTTKPDPLAGSILEILMLLRGIVGPEKSRMARKEAERRGLIVVE
ncbi:MAG TPA: hypothetical protein VMT97_08415 [Terriglobales bacterium]|nr:hypothetical protein [Terriglobales bacterium]